MSHAFPRGIPVRAARDVLVSLAALALLTSPALAATPRVHAIVGARIVVAPGQVIPRGTIVMRDGLISAVGASVAVPADARVWKGDSLTVYAGMVDAFVMPNEPAVVGRGAPAAAAPARGAAHTLAAVKPEARVVESLPLAQDQTEALRGAGFAAAQIAPRRGIVRGQSAVIGLADGAVNAGVLVPDAAQIYSLESVPSGYPGSLMGGIAVIRQSFLDARWYRDARAAYGKSPQRAERPETNVSLEALQDVIAGRQNALFVADEMLEVLRAAAIAKEAGLVPRIVTAGDEYKRVKQVAAAGASLVVPVNFPEAPDVSNADLAIEVTTEALRAWQDAPGNPAALARAGVPFALTANGLKDPKTFRTNVAKAIQRGLSPDAALAAVTTVPAQFLGLAARLGTLAPGKIANLTVTRGDLFAEKSVVREVWVDGNRYESAKDETTPAGDWAIGWGQDVHTLKVAADKDTTVTLVVGADTLKATAVSLEEQRLRFTVRRGEERPEEFDLLVGNNAVSGTLSVAGQGSHAVTGRPAKGDTVKVEKETLVVAPVVMGNTEPWRMSQPPQRTVLVRNATLWTAGPKGTLAHTDLLVKGGRIEKIGEGLALPAGALLVDATGKHVAPGVIDEHSHAAILGNVNECTNSVTCEVRIADVVNSENVNIYRQLAGGTTMMHLLHGSCNAIGGQCAVIKNRWGAAPDELIMQAAPPTVKFALGENPKQSNWGADRTGRYPQSRAGVEQVIREAFLAGKDYQSQWAEFRSGKRAIPPRRDLQLEAISEILAGKRQIHCHSYRQDEILMLIRLTESFGIHVNTFTHILEGYKVADEMAAHGSSGMGFTDWWGYKQEVIDAIPWNGYLMWDRGVNVGFNSDSDELARRLNSEAAKAIKYGGMPPAEAIKTVTINPARSLLIADRVGSLEVGKDADFAIWSGPPMSAFSHCEQTWIEGRKYFDRTADLAARADLAKERAALIAKAKAAKKGGAPAGRLAAVPRYLEETDESGNECGGRELPFVSESARRERQNAEVRR